MAEIRNDEVYFEDLYMPAGDVGLYTLILRPAREGKYPTVLMRTPYVLPCDHEELRKAFLELQSGYAHRGYCFIFQHCRGCGESEGDFIPYAYERQDGLALQEWVRHQSFYNGEIYLHGASYTSVLQYCTAPFAEDIKGAVLDVVAPLPYESTYRNGVLKSAMMANWYTCLYKQKTLKKNYSLLHQAFDFLPLRDLIEPMYKEPCPIFERMLRANEPDDPFWTTPEGMGDMSVGLKGIRIPVLIGTGHADLAGGALVNYWNSLAAEDKAHCALVIAGSDHGDGASPKDFPWKDSRRAEHLGENHALDFFDACRGKRPFPAPLGRVTSFCYFAPNPWETDDYTQGEKPVRLSLGEDTVTYMYNPFDAPSFPGSITNSFTGVEIQPPPNWRRDVISRYTAVFEKDTFIRGPFDIELTFSSDCEDTGIFVRVSIETEKGDLALQDDINTLARLVPDYKPGQKVKLMLHTDWHSLMIPKGKRLRVDFASANRECFMRHTNVKGHYMDISQAKLAHNTLYLGESALIIYER